MEKFPLADKLVKEEKFLNALAGAYRLQEAIINTTELSIISCTPEGIITSFNHAAELMLGYSAEEMIGKKAVSSFHEENEIKQRAAELTAELGQEVKPGFEVFTIKPRLSKIAERREWIYIKKTGEHFPVLLSVTALRDEKDALMGFVGIATDITEIKSAELELKKSESKFRIMAENIPGVIYLCNNDEVFSMIYLNRKVEELTGYSDENFISGTVNFVQLYHPEDRDNIFEKVDKALLDRTSFQLAYRIKHRSGEWRWVEEVGTGVYHDDNLLFIEGFITDITNQKLAEEKLQKIAEENYRLFNNAVNLTSIVGFDGYFKRINQTWIKLLGWSEEEILTKPMIEFIHADDIDATKKASRYISRGNNLESFENRFRCKDGSYRWLLWASASDVPNQLFYGNALDITERKKNEEELLRSKQNLEIAAENLLEQNRLLDEFAHIISHNLRSPIGNIQALIGLLNKYSSVEDYSMVFDKLSNLAKNLGETMNELMDTLKVKTNTDIEKVEIRFKDLLDKVIQSLEGEMIHAGASITYDFNAAPKVLFAKAYLESIFQNLLTNAIKYRSPNRTPEIRITSSIKNGRVQLRVSDNGLGIDLAKFGDKLFGLHKTFHEHKEAKGVGLFLTKTQIETLNGKIGVESEVDKGTTFIVTF
jgi:PAS domain S-box-containing protein